MNSPEPSPRIKVGTGLALSAIAIGAMLIAAFMVWDRFPEDARLPFHWNSRGEINGFAAKGNALLFAPSLAALITAILVLAPLLTPPRRRTAAWRGAYYVAWVGTFVALVFVHYRIISAALQ